MTKPATRHALQADLERLAASLASAFAQDPVMQWIFADASTRQASLETWMRFNLDMGLTRGHTYLAGGGQAAAIWSPPDVSLFDAHWGPAMASTTTELVGERAAEVMQALSQTFTAAPDEPFFYLFVLGVHADAQGQGLGADLITPVLEVCDREGISAHLESSNPNNLSFYQRHGFEVTHEIELADGGPVVRPMHRTAR
jgi:ribosomal protein S18 acetylase RimI-like enzyme